MPAVTIQSGPKNARTDPQSGLRFYRWQGRELPSVTSIRRMAGLPHGLHQWALGKVVEYACGHADELAAAVTNPDPAIAAMIRRKLREAATAERDAAADLGTAVHDAAAQGVPLEDADEAIRPRLAQFYDWLRVSGAEPLAREFQLFNLTVGYAGSADLLCRMRDGSIYLVDLKTGKGVYGEHALQLIAYLMAEFAGADDVVDDETSGLLGLAQGMALLHLSDSGWEFRKIREDAETWEAFQGLLRFAMWMKANDTADAITVGKRSGSAVGQPVAA